MKKQIETNNSFLDLKELDITNNPTPEEESDEE